MNHVRIWLVDSVKGRVWTARTSNKARGCQRFPLLSALWLVGDNIAVSLRCVWTHDRVMTFLRHVQVVLLLSHPAYPVFSWLHVHSWTSDPRISSHGPLKTSSHLAVHIHVSPILTRLCRGRTSQVVPILPFGSGASWLLTTGLYSGRRRRRCSLDSTLMCISLEMRRDCNGKTISSRCRTLWSGEW